MDGLLWAMGEVNQVLRGVMAGYFADKGIEADAELRVYYHFPEKEAEYPCVSYYTLHDAPGVYADNDMYAEEIHIAVDVWAEKPEQMLEIAEEAQKTLRAAGWKWEYSTDLFDGVYHRHSRFAALA